MADLTELAKRLQERTGAQANLLAALTAHPTLVGYGREQALTGLLRDLIPRRFEVLSGSFIPQPATGTTGKSVFQVDLMVIDTTEYPTLFRAGDIAVVLPHSIRTIVEVKSGLGAVRNRKGKIKKGETFLTALEQIGNLNLHLLPDHAPLSVLFSFAAPVKNSTLSKWIMDAIAERNNRIQLSNAPTCLPKQKSTLRESASRLTASVLPSMIVSVSGAVAIKVETPVVGVATPYYSFFRTKAKRPVMAAFVEHVVSTLGAVVASRHVTGGHVDDAFKLVAAVLDSGLEPDPKVASVSVADTVAPI